MHVLLPVMPTPKVESCGHILREKFFVCLTLACPKPRFESDQELVGRGQKAPPKTAQETFQPCPA